MRKSLLTFVFIFYLAFPAAYAAPCYGTKMPGKNKFSIGLQNHIIFKRYQKDEMGKLRSLQNFLNLSYGIFDWLAIDLKGGVGNIKQHPLGSDEIDYPTFMGGGYGFRAKLYDQKDWRIVFGFQHISIHPHTVHLGEVKHKAVLDDWQFSGLVSYDFKKITPYIGTRWSRLDYIHWIDGERKRVKSDPARSQGLILGMDIPFMEKFWVNLEGSFFDSEALAISLNYNF